MERVFCLAQAFDRAVLGQSLMEQDAQPEARTTRFALSSRPPVTVQCGSEDAFYQQEALPPSVFPAESVQSQ